jgi:hypothetical protein
VLVPEGLEVATPRTELQLAAWEEAEISVGLTNRTALAGSRYPVFVAVEYDDGPVHQALVVRNIVEILASDSPLERHGQYLWIGAAVLGLLFLALVVFRLLRH